MKHVKTRIQFTLFTDTLNRFARLNGMSSAPRPSTPTALLRFINIRREKTTVSSALYTHMTMKENL